MSKWSDDQIILLNSLFPHEAKEVILDKIKEKSWDAIVRKARKLGINRYFEDWSPEELDFLTNNYAKMSNKDLKIALPRRLGNAICMKASLLGIKKDKNAHGRHWHDDEIKYLEQNYLHIPKHELLQRLTTKTWTAIKLKANGLGITLGRKRLRDSDGKIIKRKISLVAPLNPNRRIKANVDNLASGTPEALYWLGFIAADGCIVYPSLRLSFRLAVKDKEQVLKFANFMGVKNVTERYFQNHFKKKNIF